VFFRVSRARNRTGQCAAAHKNSPVDCFLARGRFPRVSPETLQLMLECFFVYPERGIEQGSAPQRTKNSPVDCFLARGRFPRVSPETLQLMLECFFVYPVQGIEPDGAQVLLCAIMERCVFGCILDMKIPPELSAFFLCLL